MIASEAIDMLLIAGMVGAVLGFLALGIPIAVSEADTLGKKILAFIGGALIGIALVMGVVVVVGGLIWLGYEIADNRASR